MTTREEEVLLQTENVRARRMRLAPGTATPWHHHSEVTDHMVCLEGQIRVELEGPEPELLALAPGGLCRVPVGRVHRVANAGAGEACYLLLQGVGRYDFLPAE